jgi:cysteine-rich repeat protein
MALRTVRKGNLVHLAFENLAWVAMTLFFVSAVAPRSVSAVCPDGIVEIGEACDDGNGTGDDGCEPDCTLSPGCNLYPASGLPVALPDVATTTSQVTVTQTGSASEIEIVGLSGTHTWLGDLRFRLIAPSSFQVTVIDSVCTNNDNFNLSLDDDAPTGIICPLTDGQPHRPSSFLSAFEGQSVQGNWTLSIQDQAGGDSGNLNAWTLKVCSSVCGDGQSGVGEQCDDGNLVDGDGCDSTCRNTGCGSGVPTGGEACDDGNAVEGDGCDSNCTVSACGNGIQAPDEECDDGNLIDADGCDSQCNLPCPQSLCTCLDDAGRFGLVSTKVDLKAGRLSASGYSYNIATLVSGSVCGVNGKFSGKLDATTDISGSVALTAPAGRKAAGSFKGYKEYGVAQPGVFIGGDLVTGGGAISGEANVDVGGITNTTGAHALVNTCSLAMTDAQAASDYFLTLSGQTLPEIEVGAEDFTTINAGPGVQVYNVPAIIVKSKRYYGYPIGGVLEINVGPTTDVVVFNVEKKVSVGNAGSIVVTGDPAQVILNVYGERNSVKVGKEAVVDPPILAPGAKATLAVNSVVNNLLGTEKAGVKGGNVTDILACE